MVFFNCNSCGEALRKNQVEKHYKFQCRNCTVLSCVDCQKDFPGETYKEHTKCITEDEKYSGKNWKPKVNANKGEQKQEAWTQQVVLAIEKCRANPKLKDVLLRIKDYPNIPRKKGKFENFLTNSMRVRDPHLITMAWIEINAEISQAKSEEKGEKTTTEEPVEANGTNSAEEPKTTEKKLSKRERKEERRKKQHKPEKKHKGDVEMDSDKSEKKKAKKRKLEAVEEEEEEDNGAVEATKQKKKKKHMADQDEEELEESPEDTVKPEKFRWDTIVLNILEKAPDNEMALKKLKKKVLSEFYARGGDGSTFTEEKLMSKFNKKVMKNPRFKIRKERIKLSH